MKITFLGTGTSQGVPIISCQCEICNSNDFKDKRLRSSLQIENEGKIAVIDSGPDFRQQMLRAKTEKLDALIFTHEHKDHIAGMDDIRGFNYSQNKPIDVYCSNQVLEALKREFKYIFDEIKYPGIPEINIHIIENNKPFEAAGILFEPIEVWHYKLPVLGFKINNFAYITDANKIEEKEFEKIKNIEHLVLNALRNETHISHFTLQQAISLSQQANAKNVYFTHISHQLGFHHKVNSLLPENMQLAYDNLVLEI